MKYILDDKKIIIFPVLLKYLGSGKEGKVYKYKDKALKIFHDQIYVDSMDINTCLFLKNLDTKRILLPQNILYDIDYDFKGYTTDLINKKNNVYSLNKEEIIIEIEELEKEVNYLINKRIVLNDWNFENFIFDGKFRIVDPGLYKLDKKESIKTIKRFNYLVLKDFIFNELFKNKIRKEIKNYNEIIFYLSNKCRKKYNVSSFFEKEMNNDETLNQYIKRIVKK